MRTTSQTWKDIVAKGEFNMESVARIYGATGSDPNGTAGSDSRGSYREYATITAPIITRALLSGDAVSVGNTIASQLNFSVMTTDTIPKSAMIVIRARVKDFTGTTFSEWLEFGTYWIDHRVVNDNITDIEAYDAMKKGNQAYVDNSQSMNWPKSIWVVVQRIAEQMGVGIDSRTSDFFVNGNTSGGSQEIILKPSDDMVLLDILRYIGEMSCGNWIITDINELRFVRLVSPPDDTSFIIDEAHNLIKTDQGDYLTWRDYHSAHTEQTHPYGGGTCYVPVVLGSLTTANKYTITSVTIARDADNVYTRGDDTGYELVIPENVPYVNSLMSFYLYANARNKVYAPFEATSAIFDPTVELGDWIIAGEVYSVLYNAKLTFDVGFSADISAPGRNEMEDEYPYQTIKQKTKYIAEQVNENRTIIEQTQSQVSIIAEDYTKASTIRSTFAVDPTNITLSSGVDQQGNPTGQITFNAGTLLVNSTNFKLDKDGYLECYGAKIGSTGYNSYTEKNNTITIENGYISGYASNLNDKCLIEFDSIGTTSGQSYSFMKLNAPYIDMSANVGYAYVYGKDQANISAGSRNSYGRTPCEIDLDFGGIITIRGYSVQINDNSSQYLGFNGYIYMLTDLNGGWAQYKVVNGFIVQ